MWIKSFETFIERKTKDPSERLYYLSKFTADGAKEAVSGLLPLDSEEAYVEAKRFSQADLEIPFWFQMLIEEKSANGQGFFRKMVQVLEGSQTFCNTATPVCTP